MKYKLPILFLILGGSWMLLESTNLLPRLSSFARAPVSEKQEKIGKVEKKSGEEVPSAATPDPQQLVWEAAQQLIQEEVLQANIQQRINLYGQQLVGTGQYRHFGRGDNKRLRLELKLQAAGQLTSLTQVSDGRHLWTRENLSRGTVLSRIDLRRVRTALEQSASGEADKVEPSLQNWVVMGGLPRLLSSLHAQFQFDSVVPSQLSSTPVWEVEGHWKAEVLQRMKQRFAGQGGELPPHLPDSVKLVLGRDKIFPLFPYEVQYLRESGSGQAVPIVTLQLRQVTRRVQMDNSQFEYQRGDQTVIDRTDAFLQQVGLGNGG
jgi:hypothetical protein